jgi:hypothetical protein
MKYFLMFLQIMNNSANSTKLNIYKLYIYNHINLRYSIHELQILKKFEYKN